MARNRNRGPLVVSAGLVIVGVSTIAIGMLMAEVLGSRDDSAAAWVTAAATLATLLAAVLAARYAAGALRLERDRERRRSQEQRMAQANLVAAWQSEGYTWRSGKVTVHLGPGAARESREDVPAVPESVPVTIRNASRLPVHQMHVDLYVRGSDQTGPLRPAGSSTPLSIVLPETTVHHDAMALELEATIRAALDSSLASRTGPSVLAIGYRFTDHAGITWQVKPGSSHATEISVSS